MQLPIPKLEETDLNCKQTPIDKSERNLLAAMLSRAICDGFGAAQTEPQIRRDAKHWLFCELQPDKPFTFAWTALHLDLDPFELQKILREEVKNPEKFAAKLMILRS